MKYWEILLTKHRERGKDGLTIPFLIGSQQYLKSDEIQDIPGLINEMANRENFETCIRYCMGIQTLIAEIRKPKNEVFYVIGSNTESTNLSIGISFKEDLGENLDSIIKTLVDKFQPRIDSGLYSAEPNVDQRRANWQKYSEEDIQFIKNSFNEFQI